MSHFRVLQDLQQLESVIEDLEEHGVDQKHINELYTTAKSIEAQFSTTGLLLAEKISGEVNKRLEAQEFRNYEYATEGIYGDIFRSGAISCNINVYNCDHIKIVIFEGKKIKKTIKDVGRDIDPAVGEIVKALTSEQPSDGSHTPATDPQTTD